MRAKAGKSGPCGGGATSMPRLNEGPVTGSASWSWGRATEGMTGRSIGQGARSSQVGRGRRWSEVGARLIAPSDCRQLRRRAARRWGSKTSWVGCRGAIYRALWRSAPAEHRPQRSTHVVAPQEDPPCGPWQPPKGRHPWRPYDACTYALSTRTLLPPGVLALRSLVRFFSEGASALRSKMTRTPVSSPSRSR